MDPNPDRVLAFKIVLRRVQPEVWREIEIPGHATFWDLHVAIQDAMGWTDFHPHDFTIANPVTHRRDRIGVPAEDDWDETLPGWKLLVTEYYSPLNPDSVYRYDFGDAWEHDVCFQGVRQSVAGTAYPRCAGGQRQCPPEDCGGPDGYLHLLNVLREGTHPEHVRVVEWLGGKFDPEDFDPGLVQFDDPAGRWQAAIRRTGSAGDGEVFEVEVSADGRILVPLTVEDRDALVEHVDLSEDVRGALMLAIMDSGVFVAKLSFMQLDELVRRTDTAVKRIRPRQVARQLIEVQELLVEIEQAYVEQRGN